MIVPVQKGAHSTHCICELTLYDTTSAINTPLCRSRRSCAVTTPGPTESQPYADHCTIQLRTPFMIESDYFLSARSRRAKSHPDINLAPESFAAHIALQPIQGYPFPPPMFLHETYEFEAFDHLEQAVADWKTLFNPLEGNLTTAILDLPELRLEGWEKTSIPDIVMLSSTGDFGKWNFGFEVQVGWNKQFQLPTPVILILIHSEDHRQYHDYLLLKVTTMRVVLCIILHMKRGVIRIERVGRVLGVKDIVARLGVWMNWNRIWF